MKIEIFVPLFGNLNPNTRYYIHTKQGKKEIKHKGGAVYYYCINRKKCYLKMTGSPLDPNFVEV